LASFIRWQLRENDPVIQQSHQVLVGDPRDGIAMPWHVAWADGRAILWHGGGSFGMSAQLVLFPSQHEGYVLLANDTCEGTEGALKQIAISLQSKLSSGEARAVN
jgi:hypothetical protein